MFRITTGIGRLNLLRPSTFQSLRYASKLAEPIIPKPLTAEFIPELEQKRIVPKTNTYYAENPPHEKVMKDLNDLLRKYITLPTDSSRINKWLTYEQYQASGGGERLRPGEHRDLTAVLSRLYRIDAQLMPKDVEAVVEKYTRSSTQQTRDTVIKQLDSKGRSKTVGRRKSASAIVLMARGTGEILVNGLPINKVFRRLTEREQILYPLKVVESEGAFNIFATVTGGGMSGKVGAIVNGIAKGLVIHNPLLKPRLYKAGCMTRDHRVKERKKPGLRKARKAPTWVKR